MLFGILIYDGVEAIDLATFGVLSMARRIRPEIAICTIAPRAGVTLLANGLRVCADYDYIGCSTHKVPSSSNVAMRGWHKIRSSLSRDPGNELGDRLFGCVTVPRRERIGLRLRLV